MAKNEVHLLEDEEPYMGVPFHWKTRVSIECKVKSDEGKDKFADCQNCPTSNDCNYARHVKLAGIIGKLNREYRAKHPDKVERKSMKVKGGEAWVEHRTFASTTETATAFLAKCSDGIIREVVRFGKLNGTTTGDCPECHQMPCNHTAKLLGWNEKPLKRIRQEEARDCVGDKCRADQMREHKNRVKYPRKHGFLKSVKGT